MTPPLLQIAGLLQYYSRKYKCHAGFVHCSAEEDMAFRKLWSNREPSTQHAHFRRLPHTVTGEFVSNGNYYKYIVVVAQVDHDAMNIDYGRVPFLVVLLATGRHVRNGQVLPGQSACH